MKVRTTRPVAPEDLRPGRYVTITRVMFEIMPPMCDWLPKTEVQPVRLWAIPPVAGQPMKVQGVCLPFVLVETVDRQCRTLDLRRLEIVRLPKKYGRAAFERLAKPSGPARAGPSQA